MAKDLGYDKSGKRYVQMVKGHRFTSTKGIGKREAKREFNDWYAKIFGDDKKEVEQAQAAVDAVEASLKAVGMTWETAPNQVAGEMLRSAMASPQIVASETMASLVTEYLEHKKSEVSAKRLNVTKSQLEFLLEHFKYRTINRADWKMFIEELKKRNRDRFPESGIWSPKTALDVRNTVLNFLRWCKREQKIDSDDWMYLLDDELCIIRIPNTQPEFFNEKELKELFAKCEGEREYLRFLMTLMLNIGATQEDLSQIKSSQIDLKAGTLTRQRTKHKYQPRAPFVKYQLWPVVIQGLKKWMNNGEFAFVRNTGRMIGSPLVIGRDDWLAWEYDQIRGEQAKTLKYLRKTGATIVGSKFRHWRQIYLANAPDDVTDKNYDGTTDLPKNITELIRKQLGL